MISYIKGELAEVTEEGAVIETGGIGYGVLISGATMAELPTPGHDVQLFTHFSVSEDAVRLYGFATKEEREIFRQILKVSGIGPKGALSILSTLSVENLRFAVMADDIKAISEAPGIGRKTAQKLILELKDKIHWGEEVQESSFSQKEAAGASHSDGRSEALLALTALGYGGTEAHKAVKQCDLPEDADAEEWIREALKYLA